MRLRRLRSMSPRSAAFTLLEVMVAVALLSLGLVLLLQVQARSIQLAQEARDMTVATQLLRGKLLDCEHDLEKRGFSVGDYDEEGSFDDEGYPQLFWECHAYQPKMPVPDSADVGTALSAGGADEDTTAAAGDATGQGDAAAGFLAPVLSQMAGVLGESIRELVVVVRWGEGADRQEMTATTHLIEKTAVNNIASMLQSQCRAPGTGGGGATGASGGGRGSSSGSKGGKGSTPTSPTGPRGSLTPGKT